METSEKASFVEKAFRQLQAEKRVKTQGDFARLLDVSQNTISAAKNGDERYLTDNLIARINNLLGKPDVNTDTIPVIPVEAMAGTLNEFFQSVSEYDCERMVSPVRGADYAIKVNGDSMSPEIPNGSVVLVHKILEDQFVEWGKVFCLDTANGAVIKRVFPTDDPEVIECRSINPEFPSFRINTRHINGWYRVLMVMSFK